MRFFLKMRATSKGTSHQMVRLVFRHFAAYERFARRYRNEPSPEILHTLLLKPLSRSRSVAGVHVCVRVCGCVLCMLCAVLCYICSKNMRKSINMENKTGSNHGHNVVRKCKKKTQETLGKYQNMVSLFWHDMAIHGPKKGPNLATFPDALFLRFPWDLPTILAGGPNPNAQKGTFGPEVLIQRS